MRTQAHPLTSSEQACWTISIRLATGRRSSITLARTLAIDETPVVYDPVDSPRIAVDVLFGGNGVINLPDVNSFGLLNGRTKFITPRSGARFRVAGLGTTGTISADGSFVLAISFAMRSALPNNGLIDIEVETSHDSGDYVGTKYHIYKRPNHFGIAFVDDRDADGTLTVEEPSVDAGSLRVRFDIPD